MSLNTFPYYHTDALLKRFEDHLQDAASAKRISAVEANQLSRLTNTVPQPDAGTGTRVDYLDAVSASGKTIALISTLLISRSTQTAVFIYNPVLGIMKFDDRLQARDALIKMLGNAETAVALLQYTDAEGYRQWRNEPVVEVEDNLIEGAVFEWLMLAINARLSQNLTALQTLLLNQPVPETLLTQAFVTQLRVQWPDAAINPATREVKVSAQRLSNRAQGQDYHQSLSDTLLETLADPTLIGNGAHELLNPDGTRASAQDQKKLSTALRLTRAQLSEHCTTQLENHWTASRAEGLSPAEQLTHALRSRFLETVTQLAWSNDLSNQEYRTLIKWSKAEHLPELQAWYLKPTASTTATVPLETVMLLGAADAPSTPCYSYTPTRGLKRHTNRQAFLNTLAIDNVPLLPMQAPALQTYTQRLLSLPRQRLTQALRQQGPLAFVSVCQKALKLESLIDPCLPRLMAPYNRKDNENTASLTAIAQDLNSEPLSLKDLKHIKRRLEQHNTQLLETRPSLDSVTLSLIENNLCYLLGSMPAASVLLQNVADGTPDQSLSELIWQNLSKRNSTSATQQPAEHRLAANAQALLPQLTAPVIAQCVDKVTDSLRHYLAHAVVRNQNQERHTAQNLYGLTLRLELQLARQKNSLAQPAIDLIQAVLNYPTSRTRPLLKGAPAMAWELYITYKGKRETQVANLLLLSSSPPETAEAPLILWTRALGFETFTSLQSLNQKLQARLTDYHSVETLYDCVAEQDNVLPDSAPLAPQVTPPTLSWSLIKGNVLQRLEALDSNLRQRNTLFIFDQIINAGLSGSGLPELLHTYTPMDSSEVQLLRFKREIREQTVRATIPKWLLDATYQEKFDYLEILARNLLNISSEEDYLSDMPTIEGYTYEQLATQLDHDFPANHYPPDDIFITTIACISTLPPIGEVPSGSTGECIHHRQTLVEYALNHFRDWSNPITALELKNGAAPPAAMNVDYIKNLVRHLDIGSHYQTLFSQTFDSASPGFNHRLELFCRQVPDQLLERAFNACLKRNLSKTAVTFVKQVVQMPDATARLPLDGKRIQLTPLALIAQSDFPADIVPDLYLFRAEDADPVVLYAPYCESFTFREFSSPTALLAQLKTDTALQALVLGQLPEPLRKRYDNNGFDEPHLPFSAESDFDLPLSKPGPVTLANLPVKGNALHYLFEENIRTLKGMLDAQLISTEKADWESLKHILGLVFNQLSFFVPGKIGLLLGAWQAEMTVLQIARNDEGHNWPAHTAELLCVLVQSLLIGHSASTLSDAENLNVERQFWQNLHLDEHSAIPLARYEAPTQALELLVFDSLTQVYRDAATGKHYVNIDGRVYRATLSDANWYLIDEAEDNLGPRLRLSAANRWEIDPTLPLPIEHGAALTRLGGQYTRWKIRREDVIIVASGMRQIQDRMPSRAQKIRQAHRTAMMYLTNCLKNLRNADPATHVPAETQRIISDFFGVPALTEPLLRSMHKSVNAVIEMMGSGSYSPVSSSRYLIGTSTMTSQGLAFTVPSDLEKQIFMLDGYFDYSFASTFTFRAGYTQDDAAAIFRAAVLVHEFTHLAYNTRDICYNEGTLPFLNLLATAPKTRWLKHRQDTTFSHRTPANELFVIQDHPNGAPRDIRDEDRKGRRFILQTTGTSNLNDARQVFLSDAEKRAQIMLKNADSLTLLIFRMGERLHSPSVPTARVGG
ncbi:dermonecrotic toxin domain-containing protein [Pseudomonas defluvii]|uniref:dermonecrotic toxin domain-containing protein n=1 Tax=Pseudomonas defluvii TaxID=1876757 RepID=UPI003905A87E